MMLALAGLQMAVRQIETARWVWLRRLTGGRKTQDEGKCGSGRGGGRDDSRAQGGNIGEAIAVGQARRDMVERKEREATGRMERKAAERQELRQPVVGITCTLDAEQNHERVNCEYIVRVAAAGAIPVLLSPVPGGQGPNEAMAERYLGLVDGLLLSGGGDIHPRHYSAADTTPEALALVDLVDENRDWLELALARRARQLGVPTLGICRGCQAINVAAGGTMHADLLTEGLASATHRQEPPYTVPSHEVRYSRQTRIAPLLREMLLAAGSCHHPRSLTCPGEMKCADDPGGAEACLIARTNSMHHQCVAAIGEGLVPIAWSEKITEGIYDPDLPFYLGVQWHPEYLDAQAPLFEAFVKACER